MIHAVTYTQRTLYHQLLNDMYEARDQVYAGERHWLEMTMLNDHKMDQFDTPGTIYLLALGKKHQLQGALRLVPTVSTHMLNTLFPELCQYDEIPHGQHIWELSRLFICNQTPYNEEGLCIKNMLLSAMVEFCLRHEITSLTTVCNTYFIPHLIRLGFKVMPLGPSKRYKMEEIAAVRLELSQGIVPHMRSAFGISTHILVELADPSDGLEQSSFFTPDAELDLLEKTFTLSSQSEFAEELASLIPSLASDDPEEVSQAENQLDRLAGRVRLALSQGDFFSTQSIVLH